MPRSDKNGLLSKRQSLAHGSLIFHWMLWLLLVGAVLPSAFADEPGEGRIVFDIDDPPDLNYHITDWLRFGAEIDAEFFLQNDFDLNGSKDDRLAGLTPELSLAWGIELTPFADAYLEILFEQGVDVIAPGSEPHREASVVIDEAYLNLREPIDGLSIRIGRARVADDREWLFDQELDGLHLFARWKDFGLELAANRFRLVDEDLLNHDDREEINNYFALGRYAPGKGLEINPFVLVRDNQDPGSDDLTFFGLQARAALTEDWRLWLDTAHVRGHDAEAEVRGTAVDAGVTYAPAQILGPSVTLGFAFGSGDDDPDDQIDHAFRQTGFEENQDAFNGVTQFKYYGEAFDPELSNLAILTAGFGIRPSQGSSIDLVYHRYWQHHASNSLRGSALEAEPAGSNRHLGDEVDLIIGITEFSPLEAELRLGAFFPGSAFRGSRDPAYIAVFETVIEF